MLYINMNKLHNYADIQSNQTIFMSINAFIFPNMTFSNWFHDFPFQVISEINLNILYSQPHSFSSALVFLIIIWLLIRHCVHRACKCSWNLIFHMREEQPSPFNYTILQRQRLLTLLRGCMWTSANKTQGSLQADVCPCTVNLIPAVLYVKHFEVRNVLFIKLSATLSFRAAVPADAQPASLLLRGMMCGWRLFPAP